MYVFNRTRIANPTDLPEARRFAVKIAKAATDLVGQPITAFETRFGGPGAIGWSTPVADMANLDELQGKMAADPSMQKMVEKGLAMWGLPDDRLTQIIASSIKSSESSFYSSTTASPAPGKVSEAIAFGVKVQEHVSKAGFAGLFGASVFGSYGEVGWLLGADSMAQLDAFRTFQTTDAGFVKLVDSGGHLFLPGSGTNRLVSRLV
jgi:hypothetical protein